MIEEVQDLMDRYWTWLRDQTSLREVEDWVEITTPYLDHHNDFLQIYAGRSEGGWLLTDDGYVLDDLEQSGCNIDSPKRKAMLNSTLAGFGVRLEGARLSVTASPTDFSLRKHNLVQAMLSVGDLFYLNAPSVASLFYEDVVEWLDSSNIRYTPNIKFAGKSGFDHRFDFVIPKSKQKPERVLRTVNRPRRDTAQVVAFSWIDTKDVRSPDSRAYAILNDAEQQVPANVLGAVRSYGVNPLPWSARDGALEELAA